ncbi:MAG: hypothetical protein ACOX0F_01935 [Syntrophomonadaceae bacterium]|jgi:hypothetical protein
MAFFLKLVVFMVWAIIMATLIVGSTQGSNGLRRRPYTDKIKSTGDKEGGRYFLCPVCWTGRQAVLRL